MVLRIYKHKYLDEIYFEPNHSYCKITFSKFRITRQSEFTANSNLLCIIWRESPSIGDIFQSICRKSTGNPDPWRLRDRVFVLY